VSGFFITFEGGDGSGKTTQAEFLVSWLRDCGNTVVLSREPGSTAVGKAIRQLVLHSRDAISPRAEALLYAADRAQNVSAVVRPALLRGEIVVQDRYFDSSVAYQGAGRTLDATEIRELSLWAAEGLVPDLTIVLDLDHSIAQARLNAKPNPLDRVELENSAFHARVRTGYRELAHHEPGRFLVVDATESIANITKIIRARVERLLA